MTAAGSAVRIKKNRPKNGTKKQRLNRKKNNNNKQTKQKNDTTKNNKQRRRESHPGHLQVQATP